MLSLEFSLLYRLAVTLHTGSTYSHQFTKLVDDSGTYLAIIYDLTSPWVSFSTHAPQPRPTILLPLHSILEVYASFLQVIFPTVSLSVKCGILFPFKSRLGSTI
ncbi:hypothetical protein BT96DRAFT_41957 [Gymnopus androsaceus JB14]|uniref:Uncharacterized protein n=1 Tax=Gymnopus androsaceus JB14 TaxID=1447944 RepID=A0A6A4HHV6_9AGAR|nr:hypothetical protein BT96DRAFT_41957 [Gymnopus androsaceus JB14]